MRLFKIDMERGEHGREVLVHAEDEAAALARATGRYTGWSVIRSNEILGEAHFTLALLDPE